MIEVVRAREEQLSWATCASCPAPRPARGRDRQARAQVAPQLLAEPGFGPLTAGKLIGEIAGAQRFARDAKLARAGGIAPIPVSSGNTSRHRLDRGGNRQINTGIHRVASPAPAASRAQGRGPTRTYRRQNHREAIRCLRGGCEAPSAARWLAVARRRHRGYVGQGVDRCGLAIEECAELLDRAH